MLRGRGLISQCESPFNNQDVDQPNPPDHDSSCFEKPRPKRQLMLGVLVEPVLSLLSAPLPLSWLAVPRVHVSNRVVVSRWQS